MVLSKLRWLIIGVSAIAISLVSAILLLSVLESEASAKASQSSGEMMLVSDSPNAVTSGLTTAANELSRALDSTDRLFMGLEQTMSTALSRTGITLANGTQSATAAIAATSNGLRTGAAHGANGFGNNAVVVAQAVSNSVALVIYLPVSILGQAADTAVVSAVIKPTADTPAPVINQPSSVSLAAIAPAASVKNEHDHKPAEDPTHWPMRGDLTTLFGVPHWPYQPTHTGIDISDGQASGVTAIKPFKPGRVIDTVHSYSGLGNNVVVDHGAGVTSVYAHLSSISVKIGQAVDSTTTLGFQGSTGASTGTHLHFEIRINGQPVNPLTYLAV